MAFIGKFIRDLFKITTAPDDIGIEVQRKDSPTQTEFIEKKDFLKEVNQGLDDHIADIDDPHESMRVLEAKPTGLWDGGELNIVNVTNIEVVAGAGMVIDSYTDPLAKPTETVLRWDRIEAGIIGEDIAGSVVWFTLKPTTTPAIPTGFVPELIQRTTWPTPENMRDEIYLGVALHNGDGWGEISTPIVVNNAAHTLDEYLNRVTGPTFIIEGGGFTESSNPAHNLDQAPGVIWELNRNWHISKKNPHREAIPGGSNMQFKYVNRDFTEVSPYTDTIDPDAWDNNGAIEPIPGSGNTTTIQRLYLDPGDNLWILYGQNHYNSFNLALSLIGADTANTIVPDLCGASVLMGYIVTEKNKGDWDVNESRYIAQNGISAPSGGAPPITNHNDLSGRDTLDSHPSSAITDLVEHYNDSDIHETHSGISVIAGAGLVGGGPIDATRTVNIGSPSVGLTINADDIAVNFTPISIPDDGTENVAARSDHLHDGRYYTEAEIDAIMDALGLDGLNDVTVTSPGDGQKLTYDSTTGQWINTTTLEHLNVVFYGYTLTIPSTTTPASGHVSRNANDVTQVTELYVNKFDESGKDVSTYWIEIDEGDLFGYWNTDATIKEGYRAVGNAVLSGDIWTIPVEWTQNSGGDLLNGDPIRFLWRVTPNADTMIWKGVWNGDQYLRGDTVYDDGYAMVANKTTTERAAPQAVGAEYELYNGAGPTVQIIAKQVLYGVRLTVIAGGFVSGYSVYTIGGNQYDVYSVDDPEGLGAIKLLASFTATETGWSTFSIASVLLAPGKVFDLIAIAHEADASPTSWTGNWAYTTPNNDVTPAAGQAVHANKAIGSIRFADVDDNGGDRSAELAALTPGDIIHGPTIDWSIQAVTVEASYVEFAVAPAQQDVDGNHDFVFDTVSATPITYLKDVAYWDNLPADNIRGLEGVDVDYATITPDGNAYGINLTYQAAQVSEDWELLSAPGGSGGGGSGGEGTSIHNELEGRDVADTHPITAITNLSAELGGKSDISHEHTMSEIVDAGTMALVNDAPSDGNGYVRKNTGSGNIWTPEAAENLFTGYKNILMNGDFRVDQFGAYANNGWNIGVGGIGPDRWRKISETQIRQVVEKGSYEPNVPYTLSASGVFIRTETSPPEGTDWYVDVDINAIYIQLERGEFVTDWEYRPYPLELLMCQRYRVYWTDPAAGWAYNNAGSLRIWTDFNFPCHMRTTPVILRQSNAVYSNASGVTSSSNTIYARVMATVTATGQWYARSSAWKYDAEFDT